MNVNSMNRVSNNGMEIALAEVRKITETLMESDIPNDIIGRIIDPIIDDIKNERPLNLDIYCIVFEKMISMIGGAAVNSMIPKNDYEPKKKSKVAIFVGTTGSGKTSTLIKIGLNLYFGNRRKNIFLINTNTFKIGAGETIKCAAQIIGLKTEVVYNFGTMKKILSEHSDDDYIFIDTVGVFDDKCYIGQLEEMLSSIDEFSPEVILTIPASIKTNIALKIIENFKPLKVTGIIFTKIDEVDSLGTVFAVAVSSKLPIINLCNGQDIPDNIIPFKAVDVIKNILNSKLNVSNNSGKSMAV